MALSIDWDAKVITVPKADTTLVDIGPPEVRSLDLDVFRLELKSLEDNEYGISYLRTHRHNTAVTLGGIEYFRTVEIINGYTVTFENGSYRVNLIGDANSNVLDVTNYNSVQIASANSAGLQIVTQGSGITEQDKLDIADRVMDELLSGHSLAGSVGKALTDVLEDTSTTIPGSLSSMDGKVDIIDAVVDVLYKIVGHKVTRYGDVITIFEDDDVTPWRQYDLTNGGRVEV